MPDTIEKLIHSTVQHGPLNRRVYLMRLDAGDVPRIFAAMEELACRNGYDKLLARVPSSLTPDFEAEGYMREAAIPAYFSSGSSAVFMGKFLSPARCREQFPEAVARNREIVEKAALQGNRPFAPRPAEIERCGVDDAPEISNVYRRVFESYPFPIRDSRFVAESMGSHVRYYGVRAAQKIVALGACDMDRGNGNVEMTDFAVLPRWRFRGLAAQLLKRMEDAMRRSGLRVAYTISRTLSPAINIIFKRNGYRYGGQLTNNTHIAGKIESMWVWYKLLGH